MHKTLIFLLVLLYSQANAQFWNFRKKTVEQKSVTQFPRDQDNKIIFYEVVTVDTVPRDTLWKNAKMWIQNILNEKEDKITLEEYLSGTLECQVSYMVYVTSLVSKIPHGKISYNVSIDVKEKKYRYTFNNFVFQFYKQDRKDLKYHAVKKSIRPLETERYPGFQSAWNSHRADLKKKIEGQIKYLKQEIVKKNKPIVVDSALLKPVIKTKDW